MPPDDATVDRALRDFVDILRPLYGERLRGVYLFGSRARGDHTAESDADVAVILADGDWTYWDEKMRLADLEYDTIIATGAEPQGWPVRESEWLNPERHRNPELVRAMQRDAKDLLTHA
jgi:antitoxin ChpS